MAMEVQGTRRPPQDAGVKVKFIETQFISSDAASFKAVVQRLTGKSPAAAAASSQTAQAPQPALHPQRPRPCRPAFVGAGRQQQQAAGWTMDQQAASYLAMMPAPKQEPLTVAPRLEDMNELCDFADLFYTAAAAASARRDGGGSAFPY